MHLSDPIKYLQIIEALQYVTLTRPGLTFVVNILMQAPTDDHIKQLSKFFRSSGLLYLIDC